MARPLPRRPSPSPTAPERLMALRAECLALLDVIHEHVDSHFDVVPDEAHFGHVGDAAYLKERLQDMHDRIVGEGEYAEQP